MHIQICSVEERLCISFKSQLEQVFTKLTKTKLLNGKFSAYSLVLTKQNSIPHHIYYQYRNIVNSEVKRAKKLYYKEAFVRVVGNSKKTWNMLHYYILPI